MNDIIDEWVSLGLLWKFHPVEILYPNKKGGVLWGFPTCNWWLCTAFTVFGLPEVLSSHTCWQLAGRGGVYWGYPNLLGHPGWVWWLEGRNGGFLKWWYPTTMVFPTKNDHFGVFWGYHHLRKHPNMKTCCKRHACNKGWGGGMKRPFCQR